MVRQDPCLLILPIAGLAIEILYFEGIFGDFWRILTVFSAAIIALPTIYVIMQRYDFKICLAMLVMSSVFVQIFYFLSFKNTSFVPPRDAAYHLQVINAILYEGKIPLGEGVGQALAYSYYPGMHVLLSVLTMVSGLDRAIILKLSSLLYVTIPLTLYSFTYLLTKQRIIAGLAAFVFIFVPYGFYSPKYNFLAFAFFLSLVLSLSLYQVFRHANLLVTSLIFAFALSVTHHLTSYVLLGFLFSFLFVGLTFTGSRWKIKLDWWASIKWETIALMPVTVMWSFFVGFEILSAHAHIFVELFEQVEIGQEASLPFLTGSYSAIEFYWILVSLIFVLILGFIGFLFYLKDKNSNPMFILTVVLFGSLFLLSYSVRSASELLEELSLRSWSFLFLGLTPMIGYIAFKVREPSNCLTKRVGGRASKSRFAMRRSLSSLMIFLVVSSYVFSTIDVIPRQYYNFEEENETGLANVLRGFGERVAASVGWYNGTLHANLDTLGDGIFRDMLAPFAIGIHVNYDFYHVPDLYEDLLPGKGYIFMDYSFSIYDQAPEWKVVEKRIDLGNATQVVNDAKDLVKIYDNNLVSILFKER